MAKPNYSFEKRQRELAKKKKQEQKRQKKAAGRPDGDNAPAEIAESVTAEAPPPSTP